MKRVFSSLREHRLLRSLFGGALSVAVLTTIMFLLLLLLRSTPFLFYRAKSEVTLCAKELSRSFDAVLSQYCDLAVVLAEDETLLKELSDPEHLSKVDIYKLLRVYMEGQEMSPIVHVVMADKKNTITRGSDVTYDPIKYAELFSLLKLQSEQPYIYPHRLQSGETTVVLTVAKELYYRDEVVGYVLIDMAENEIESILDRIKTDLIYGQDVYSNCVISTWYRYAIYSRGQITEIIEHTNYLQREITDSFDTPKPDCSSKSFNGVDYLLAGMRQGDFLIICGISTNLLSLGNNQTIWIVSLFGILILTSCCIFAWTTSKSIADPLREILETMSRVGAGDLTVRCRFKARNELENLRDQLNALIVDVEKMIQNNSEQHEQLLLAEEHLLKAEIKPHFINNVLESVRWTIKAGNIDGACAALLTLGRMISSRMISGSETEESLSKALEWLDGYIRLQEFCYPDKVCVTMDVPESLLDARLPAFLLQPLVENAIIHGLQTKQGRGELIIRAEETDVGMLVEVKDNGAGIPNEKLEVLFRLQENGHGIGLFNVHRRLKLRYGDKSGLQVHSTLGEGTSVSFVIPREEKNDFDSGR